MADLLLAIKLRTDADTAALKDYRNELRGIKREGRKLGDSTKDFVPPELGGKGRGAGSGDAKRRQKERKRAFLDNARAAGEFGRSVEGVLDDPIQRATDYETRLANIATLTDSAEFSTKNLRDITREASLEFGGTSAEQADALYDIISAGATTAAEAQGTLSAANKLAIGGLTDVATATGALSATVANFKAQNIDAADASDILFTIVKKGRTTVSQAASAFPRVASAAGGMGIKVDEAAAAFSTLTLTASSSAEASTQAAALFAATAKPTQQARKALVKLNRQLGLTGDEKKRIDSAFLKEKGIVEFVKQFEDVDDDVLANLFGSKQARAGLVGLRANIDSLQEGITAQEGREGAATEAFGKLDKTRAQRLKVLQAQIDDAKLSVGEALIPITEQLLPFASMLAGFAGDFARHNPAITSAVGGLGFAAIGIGKVGDTIVGVSRAARGLTGVTRGLTGAAGLAFTGVDKLAGLVGGKGNLGLVGAALAAGGAIGTLIDQNFGLSDAIAKFLAGTSDEKRVDKEERTAGFLAERAVIRDESGAEVTSSTQRAQLANQARRKFLSEGFVKGDVTAALQRQGFTQSDIESSLDIGPARSRRTGGAEVVGRLDVSIKVDSEGNASVTGVTQSGTQGEVDVRNGETVPQL